LRAFVIFKGEINRILLFELEDGVAKMGSFFYKKGNPYPEIYFKEFIDYTVEKKEFVYNLGNGVYIVLDWQKAKICANEK
jgi:hypothetical protein